MSGDHIRAVRNANPGNLDRSPANKWQGLCPVEEMTDEQRDEKRFCIFKSPKWGFRAMAVVLISYQDKYGIHSISKAISRWAPPTENNTASYIASVCNQTGFGADGFLDFHRYEDLAPLVKAIAVRECGGWFFNDRDLDAGLRMAGVEPPAPSLKKSRTMQAQATAGAATAGTAVVQSLSETMDQVSQFAAYLDYAKWVMILLLVASIGVTIYARINDHKTARR